MGEGHTKEGGSAPPAMVSETQKNESDLNEDKKCYDTNFLIKYVEASNASLNRNVIAKCLEFHEIPLVDYFTRDLPLSESINSRALPFDMPNEEMEFLEHQVDSLSWSAHHATLEKMRIKQNQHENETSRPYYESISNLAEIYRKRPNKFPPIDLNHVALPHELEELLITLNICCKYYIADCLKKAQENALSHGTTVLNARHVYEAARKAISKQ